MELKLTTRGSVDLPYSTNIPPAFARYAMPGARGVHAPGEFGVALFYELTYPGFSIWYNHYVMKQSAWLQGTLQDPLLELHFVLRGPFRYQVEGLGELKLPEGHFNLVYVPALKAKAWFDGGKEYSTFSLHFTRDYLRIFEPYFPALSEFLEQTDLGKAGILNPVHTRATPEMISIIRSMLHNDYPDEVKKMYLQNKVAELLLHAFTRIAPSFVTAAEIRLHQYDIDKIREAREYLLLNMEHPLTVIELSHKVGINDFKLKKGFKQLYGVTIFDFLLEARMDKARNMLLETNTPVHEIAFATGYKNVSSFTAAFKKKMGYPPSALKRDKSE